MRNGHDCKWPLNKRSTIEKNGHDSGHGTGRPSEFVDESEWEEVLDYDDQRAVAVHLKPEKRLSCEQDRLFIDMAVNVRVDDIMAIDLTKQTFMADISVFLTTAHSLKDDGEAEARVEDFLRAFRHPARPEYLIENLTSQAAPTYQATPLIDVGKDGRAGLIWRQGAPNQSWNKFG